MRKIKLLQTICEGGIVAVLRGDTAEEAIRMADYCIKGGIRAIEITMTVPGALDAIKILSLRYSGHSPETGEHAIIGAGTVLDPETARAAILAGAEFVVAPCINEQTIMLCNRYRVPILPGVMTIQEMQKALEMGVDIMKLFPGNLFTPQIIKAIKGPLPQANLMPTGGVTLLNLSDWIRAGAVAVGIGSDLTSEAVRIGDFNLISLKAAQYVEAYKAAVPKD